MVDDILMSGHACSSLASQWPNNVLHLTPPRGCLGYDELQLVVEVPDSTLTKDRGPKLVSYAQGWIAEYWIVNLIERHLEVYRHPSPAGIYADMRVYMPGENVQPLNAPGKTVAVADLLPPEPKQNL